MNLLLEFVNIFNHDFRKQLVKLFLKYANNFEIHEFVSNS